MSAPITKKGFAPFFLLFKIPYFLRCYQLELYNHKNIEFKPIYYSMTFH